MADTDASGEHGTGDEPTAGTGPLREWPTASLILAFAALPVAILGATVLLVQIPEFPDQSLPLLLISGITIFFVAICLVVLVFKRLGLDDRTKPLGLPEGSVRAFIALTLILLFFMMSVFLYFDLARPARTTAKDLTPEQFAAIPGDQIIGSVSRTLPGGEVVHDVERRLASGASEDIARQIVTTISTLVVAISSFYFGSTVVQSERGNDQDTSGTNARPGPTPPT